MFHFTQNPLRIRKSTSIISAALLLSQLATFAENGWFDPDVGFKPAQTNLTEIFLQIAGSLEHYGHPGPYMRHIKNEHRRVEKKFEAKFGSPLPSYCPSYMTDEYLDSLIENWDNLSPRLNLAELARKSGRNIRLAIKGDNEKGTAAILMLNRHQSLTYEDMTDGNKRSIGFDHLRSELVRLFNEGEIPFLVERESELNKMEKAEFRLLLEKSRFTKADFEAIDRFYGGPYDRLSDYGKSLLSQRTFAGKRPPNPGLTEVSQAQTYAAAFWSEFESLFQDLNSQLSAEASTQLKGWVLGRISDLGVLAQSEFEVGIQEKAIDRLN